MGIEWEIAIIGAGGAIVGGLLTGLLSGVYQHWHDWRYGPVLQIDYEGSDANKVDVKHWVGDKNDEMIYIRARVRNTGRLHRAKETQVFLTALSEVHEGGTLTAAPFHDPMPLQWVGESFEPRNVPTDIPFYVNIMRVSKSTSGWDFLVQTPLASHAGLKAYKGTYRFYLTVTADNAKPATCTVDVKYDQDWHSLRAWQ